MSNNKNIPDWERQYWQQKQQGVSPLAGRAEPHVQHQMPAQNSGEVDITALLQQRAMAGQLQQAMNPGANSISSKVCHLRDGATYYRAVSNSYGTTVPLVVSSGTVAGVAGKQFENCGVVRCFVVEQNSGAIDLSKMNEHSGFGSICRRHSSSRKCYCEACRNYNRPKCSSWLRAFKFHRSH
jgi:hypothetical protein